MFCVLPPRSLRGRWGSYSSCDHLSGCHIICWPPPTTSEDLFVGSLCVKLVRWVKHFAVSGSFWDQSTQIAVDCSSFESTAAIFGTTCVAKIRAGHPKNANRRPCRMHRGRRLRGWRGGTSDEGLFMRQDEPCAIDYPRGRQQRGGRP